MVLFAAGTRGPIQLIIVIEKINRSNRRFAIDGTKRANHHLTSLHDTQDVEYVREPPFSLHEILSSLELVTWCTCVCRALIMAALLRYRQVIYCKVSCETLVWMWKWAQAPLFPPQYELAVAVEMAAVLPRWLCLCGSWPPKYFCFNFHFTFVLLVCVATA